MNNLDNFISVKHAVTIYLGLLFLSQDNKSPVSSQQSTNSILYSTVRDFSQQIKIRVKFRKIGVVFKPYGLNHFLTKSVNEFHH